MEPATAGRHWLRPPAWARVALGLGFFLFFVPWFSVQVLPFSWVFIFCAWAALMFWFAFGRPRRKRRALWFNIGVACLALACAELFLEFHQPRMAGPLPGSHDGYVQEDADLGYAPVPGVQRTIDYWYDDEKVFSTTYTIDVKGCRIGRPAPAPDAPVVVFFGGSYAYGHGLADLETPANRVAELSGDRYAPVNLAFYGYGTHHMLAMLQSGRAEAAVGRAPRHAFYLAIPHHALRVAGKAGWDNDGPWYRLQADGSVRRAGQFTDRSSSFERRLLRWLHDSKIYDLLRSKTITDDQFELLAAVAKAAQDRIAEIWPGCRFHVLLWDHPRAQADRAAAALEARGFDVHRTGEALPGFAEDPSRYALHPHDRHPNAEAAEHLARWIVQRFLQEP